MQLQDLPLAKHIGTVTHVFQIATVSGEKLTCLGGTKNIMIWSYELVEYTSLLTMVYMRRNQEYGGTDEAPTFYKRCNSCSIDLVFLNF